MEISMLLEIGFGVLVLAVALAYGLQVMGDVKSDMTADTTEYNATGEGITAVAKIPSKLGTIVTIFLAAIIIGIIVRHLYVKLN